MWEVVANVLFLNQVLTSTSLVGPAWSLSLEFWLYCLTPLLFRLGDQTLQRLVFASFFVFCAYTCGRTMFHWEYYSGVAYALNLPLLAFIWIAGLRIARSGDEHKPVLKMVGVLFALHILLAMSIQAAYRRKHGGLPEFFQTDLLGYVLQASTLALVLWSFSRVLHPNPKALPSKLLRMLGDVSYPLYLLHIPIYYLMKEAGIQAPVLFYGAAVAVSFFTYRALDLYSQRRHGMVSAELETGLLPPKRPS